MYRLTVALIPALAGTLCHGSEETGFTLALTDRTTGQPVENAVVMLENGPGEDPVRDEIVQKNREFQPHTLVIPRNSKIDFPNLDNTQHHVYSFSPAKTFNIELYAGRPTEPVVFDQTGVVELGCNIHDHMQAFVLVTDSEPFGRTNEQGLLTMKPPPAAGKTSDDTGTGLLVWHPRLADNTRMARFSIEQPLPDTLSLSVELAPEPVSNDRLDGLQERFREL